jgi:hypothetical protein
LLKTPAGWPIPSSVRYHALALCPRVGGGSRRDDTADADAGVAHPPPPRRQPSTTQATTNSKEAANRECYLQLEGFSCGVFVTPFFYELKSIPTVRKGPHTSIRVSFARLPRSAGIIRGTSGGTCLRLSDSDFSCCRRRIVVTLMSTILVPTATRNHPRQGRLPFRIYM